MPKQSGLGDNLYVDGKNISGDIGSLGSISCPMEPQGATGIDKHAMERLAGRRDGKISFSSYFNPDSLRAHPTLSLLPTADRIVTYCRGTTLGAPAAAMVAKQIGYDGEDKEDGAFTLTTDCLANAYGLEWGVQLTAGQRTDVAATNGTSVDGGAATTFGAQAYFHLFAFTGTLAAINVEGSADNVTFAAITGLAFSGAAASVGSGQRAASTNVTTIPRYLRVATSGVFTSMTFAVMVARNPVAGVVF